jgi:hypothetical protein
MLFDSGTPAPYDYDFCIPNTQKHAMQRTLQRDSAICLRIRLRNTLAHEIKEGKLACASTELVHEP